MKLFAEDSTIQYLYAKAGLRQSGLQKQISVSEACPYTAFPKDQRYIIQTQGKKDINTICPVSKRVGAQWRDVAEICSRLMQSNIVDPMLLPENCIKKSNVLTTVYNMLNHWSNSPMLEDSEKAMLPQEPSIL